MHIIDHKSYAREKFHGSLDLSSEKINGTYNWEIHHQMEALKYIVPYF